MKQFAKVGALVVLVGALAGSRMGAADDPVATADKALMTAFREGRQSGAQQVAGSWTSLGSITTA